MNVLQRNVILKQSFFLNLSVIFIAMFSAVYSHCPTHFQEQAAVTRTSLLAEVGDPSRA